MHEPQLISFSCRKNYYSMPSHFSFRWWSSLGTQASSLQRGPRVRNSVATWWRWETVKCYFMITVRDPADKVKVENDADKVFILLQNNEELSEREISRRLFRCDKERANQAIKSLIEKNSIQIVQSTAQNGRVVTKYKVNTII